MWHVKWLLGISFRQNSKLLPWKQKEQNYVFYITFKPQRRNVNFICSKKENICISVDFKRWSPVLKCIIKCKQYNFENATRKATILAQRKFFAFDDHKCCKFMQTLHCTRISTKSSFIWSKKQLITKHKSCLQNMSSHTERSEVRMYKRYLGRTP